MQKENEAKDKRCKNDKKMKQKVMQKLKYAKTTQKMKQKQLVFNNNYL